MHCLYTTAWDNLRIDVFGALQQFFHSLPWILFGSAKSLWRVSGSAVETLFSQYKYLSGNKLDAVNYTTSRAVPV